jgi:hypothetical protein
LHNSWEILSAIFRNEPKPGESMSIHCELAEFGHWSRIFDNEWQDWIVGHAPT